MAEKKQAMKLTYRELKGYKYDVWDDEFTIQTNIKGFIFKTPWYQLMPSGSLIIQPNYAWDGATDPAIDTKNFMVGSLVHDVLYQAMREEHLPRTMRESVDKELPRICREYGMSDFRAWYAYNFVRVMGERYALPEKKPRGRIVTI